MRKLLSVVALLLTVACLSSCSLFETETTEKTFSKNGMTITLTDSFSEVNIENYTISYRSKDITILALREEYTDYIPQTEMPGEATTLWKELTAKQYAIQVLIANDREFDDNTVIEENGLTYFVLNNSSAGKDYTYFSCVYHGRDAFWLIQFACLDDDYAEMKDSFMAWAKSVRV